MNLHERTLSVLACRVSVLPRLELLLPITPPPSPRNPPRAVNLGLHHAPSQLLPCCLASPS